MATRCGPKPAPQFPDTIAVREGVRKGTGSNRRLALNRDSESPRYDRICGQAFDIPEAHLVGQVLVGHAKILTPFRYVGKPIGRSIWVQPAIGRYAVDDDGSVPENAKEKVVVLGVETVDVAVD